MKLILLFAFFAFLVVCNEAQNCRGQVHRGERNCLGGRNSGTAGEAYCLRNANNEMWYYNSTTRSCRRMSYLGCRGNNNRYCSLRSCERNCVRLRPVASTTPQPSSSTTAAPDDSTPASAAD